MQATGQRQRDEAQLDNARLTLTRYRTLLAQDSIARRDALARETAQCAAEQLIQDDPEVRALMAQFRTARIVPGSIKPMAADSGPEKANPP